jgi:hypothetical protein
LVLPNGIANILSGNWWSMLVQPGFEPFPLWLVGGHLMNEVYHGLAAIDMMLSGQLMKLVYSTCVRTRSSVLWSRLQTTWTTARPNSNWYVTVGTLDEACLYNLVSNPGRYRWKDAISRLSYFSA